MAQVNLLPSKAFNTVVAHLPGVIGSVSAKADEGAARAKAILARHRHAGHAKITVTHGTVDSFVNLVDESGPEEGGPAAAAIEFGRSGGPRGATQGVRAISGAF